MTIVAGVIIAILIMGLVLILKIFFVDGLNEYNTITVILILVFLISLVLIFKEPLTEFFDGIFTALNL